MLTAKGRLKGYAEIVIPASIFAKRQTTVFKGQTLLRRGVLGVIFNAQQLEHDLKVICRIPIDSLKDIENSEVH